MKGLIIFICLFYIALFFNFFVSGRRKRSAFSGRILKDDCMLPEDFRSAVIILGATMMKKVSPSKKDEFIFFRKYYEQNFRMDLTADIISMLRTLSARDIPVSKICFHLRSIVSYQERINLLHFLYGFVRSDNYMTDGEIRLLRLMGRFMNILPADMDSVSAIYFSERNYSIEKGQVSLNQYYEILGVNPQADHDEIQKAYRKLAMKHHPDKVSHHEPEIQQAAKEKFQIIVDAYKRIRKGRGF
jgi:DnaJ like chaperone protein